MLKKDLPQEELLLELKKEFASYDLEASKRYGTQYLLLWGDKAKDTDIRDVTNRALKICEERCKIKFNKSSDKRRYGKIGHSLGLFQKVSRKLRTKVKANASDLKFRFSADCDVQTFATTIAVDEQRGAFIRVGKAEVFKKREKKIQTKVLSCVMIAMGGVLPPVSGILNRQTPLPVTCKYRMILSRFLEIPFLLF